jgi:transcription termination factor Rho
MANKNIPEEIIAIEFVNREKRIINFVKNETIFGFFSYTDQLKNPQVGDLLKVKMEKGKGDNNFYKISSIQPADPNDNCEAVKSFKGTISMENKNGFGFVDEIFIFPQLAKKFNLKNGDEIEGKAIYSYNKPKNSWGWKAFKVEMSK